MLMTGLSGNEIYCLAQKGFSPGNIVVGNSVHSLGFVRGITSGLKTLTGGEIGSVTQLIVDGRHAAINRLEQEAKDEGCQGLTGVASELRNISNLMEFIAIGSAVRSNEQLGFILLDSVHGPGSVLPGRFGLRAATFRDRKRRLCAGNRPGNHRWTQDAGAAGRGQGILGHVQPHPPPGAGAARSGGRRARLQRGCRYHHPDPQFRAWCSRDDHGRHRLVQPGAGRPKIPFTSELTGEELWNLTQMGYAPVRLLLGTSVYALGLAGGITSFFRSFARGEINEVTRMVYDARENCLSHIRLEAEELKADGVIGIKIFINEIGSGLVEVMAIGTAIRKHAGVATTSDQLIPQAIIRDRDTFFEQAPLMPGSTPPRSLDRA